MNAHAAAVPVHRAVVRRHRSVWRRVRHFARTPKGLLTVVLVSLALVAGRVAGPLLVAPGIAGAVGAAVATDALTTRLARGRWRVPDGVVLSGLLIALVLSPFEPWYVFACAAVIAVASKSLLRTKSANVFNPAALALVGVFYLFDTAQNWWGALPAIVPAAAWPLLAGSGLYVTMRVDKLPLVLAFLASYFTLFAATTFVMDPGEFTAVFVGPDLLAAVFFACFMLTDPPTSPTRYGAQVACGVLVAMASVAVFIGLGAVHYLLSGVLAGNLFEAARRAGSRVAHRARGPEAPPASRIRGGLTG